jgi:hypothetical protein
MEKLRNKTLKLKSKKSTNFLRPIVQPTLHLNNFKEIEEIKKQLDFLQKELIKLKQ